MARRDAGPHLAPVLRRGAFPALWWTCALLASATYAWSVPRLSMQDLVADGLALWLVLAMVLLSELRPVIATRRADPDGINLATAFVFAAMLRWGIDVALVALAVSTTTGELARGKRVYAVVFNVAQYALCYLAAWGVLVAGGWQATAAAPAELAPRALPLLLLAAAVYHLTNLAIVGTALALSDRRPWWATVTEGFAWYTLTTGAVLALAPLVVVVLGVHAGFLPLLVVPLALLWATANLALDRERRSLTDPLTGLPNRATLSDLFADRCEEQAHTGGKVAVCLVDLDRFKEVNDTLGHATGDALLRAVADRLRAGVREGDHVARLGGDEFVLLLDLADGTDPVAVLDRVVHALEEPYDIGGARLEVEMSIGVATCPDDGTVLEELLRRADAAMYEAKSAGEPVQVFHAELDRAAPGRMELLADLRRAADGDELELHYQPQVDLRDGHVVGVEALVRWRHPEHGLLLPCAFLPLAERTSTMRLVTAAVLRDALRQQAAWRARGIAVPVSINTSLHDLADGTFADQVVQALVDHDVPADQLQLEITEEALVGDAERVLVTLHELDRAGVALSLDDFGTGQSSLTRLKRVPVGEVKMDRNLVVDLDAGAAQDVAIVRSVLDLTRALGVRSVAEGVETPDQWRTLAELGADAAQGWLIARPMPADEATAWLLERGGGSTGDVAAAAPSGGAPAMSG